MSQDQTDRTNEPETEKNPVWLDAVLALWALFVGFVYFGGYFWPERIGIWTGPFVAVYALMLLLSAAVLCGRYLSAKRRIRAVLPESLVLAARVFNSRYEVLEDLPDTEDGAVKSYKARDVDAARVVLLRVVPAVVERSYPSILSDFQSRIQSTARLEHLHIARVTDCGHLDDRGDLYLASDFIRGITLRERIRRVAPFSLAVAADIAAAIVEAVVFAHQQGIAHGALSPEDIVLSPEGQIRVADFGTGAVLALGLGRETLYTDPDRAAGEPRPDDDIYAVGIILFEMLTGKAPTGSDRLRQVSPRAANPGVPAALEGIILKAIHTDFSQRYRTATELLDDLQEVRDALRTGKPLTWSPLTKSSSARPARPTAPKPAKPRPGAISAAAAELEDEREPVYVEPFNPLGAAVKVLLAIVVIGVVALGWYGSSFLAVPNDVVVPNLIGKTFDDAKRIAQQQSFILAEGGSDYSTKWPENQVYRQDPAAGLTVKAGRSVTVFRSLGPRLLQVPDLTGMTRERAVRALQDGSFPAPTINEQFSETVQAGVVISQDPAAKGNAARGTTVTMVVSKGKQPPDMPSAVTANPVTPTRIDVSWQASARAESYRVVRIADGNPTVVSSSSKKTTFSDIGLEPNTSYSYTVTAVNAAGESDSGDPALAITPPTPSGTPSVPDNLAVSPPSDTTVTQNSSSNDGSDKQTQLRQFEITFRVPRRPRGNKHVQFEVQDATGTTLVYDEHHDSGERIGVPVTAFGSKVMFRIFVDGKLMKQQTL